MVSLGCEPRLFKELENVLCHAIAHITFVASSLSEMHYSSGPLGFGVTLTFQALGAPLA